MKKLSHSEILKLKPTPEEVKSKRRNPIYVLLNDVRSLHNVGAIFRSCDGVLAEKLFLCGITGAPPRKEIAKTALGAEELVPWEYSASASEAVDQLKASGVEIVAVELAHGAEIYSEAAYDRPVCFVFGNEAKGIGEEVMSKVDRCVFLPMLGRANSLNVSTCCGVVLYDALRKIVKH